MGSADRFRAQSLADRKSLMKMHEGFAELRALGWSEPIYIPADLDEILAIELGSCGMFVCRRVSLGEDRTAWFARDGDDDYPCRPTLWRRVPARKSSVPPPGGGG